MLTLLGFIAVFTALLYLQNRQRYRSQCCRLDFTNFSRRIWTTNYFPGNHTNCYRHCNVGFEKAANEH